MRPKAPDGSQHKTWSTTGLPSTFFVADTQADDGLLKDASIWLSMLSNVFGGHTTAEILFIRVPLESLHNGNHKRSTSEVMLDATIVAKPSTGNHPRKLWRTLSMHKICRRNVPLFANLGHTPQLRLSGFYRALLKYHAAQSCNLGFASCG